MSNAKAKAAVGFKYDIELVDRFGNVLDRQSAYNLIPVQGLNYILGASLKQASQIPSFYIGLFEGAYTPVPGDTMATFPASATELVAYSEATRRVLTLGDIEAGAADNSLARVEFTGTTDGKLVHGGFISSSPNKGAATGVLISAVRFPSPKPLDAGATLRVTAGFSIISI